MTCYYSGTSLSLEQLAHAQAQVMQVSNLPPVKIPQAPNKYGPCYFGLNSARPPYGPGYAFYQKSRHGGYVRYTVQPHCITDWYNAIQRERDPFDYILALKTYPFAGLASLALPNPDQYGLQTIKRQYFKDELLAKLRVYCMERFNALLLASKIEDRDTVQAAIDDVFLQWGPIGSVGLEMRNRGIAIPPVGKIQERIDRPIRLFITGSEMAPGSGRSKAMEEALGQTVIVRWDIAPEEKKLLREAVPAGIQVVKNIFRDILGNHYELSNKGVVRKRDTDFLESRENPMLKYDPTTGTYTNTAKNYNNTPMRQSIPLEEVTTLNKTTLKAAGSHGLKLFTTWTSTHQETFSEQQKDQGARDEDDGGFPWLMVAAVGAGVLLATQAG